MPTSLTSDVTSLAKHKSFHNAHPSTGTIVPLDDHYPAHLNTANQFWRLFTDKKRQLAVGQIMILFLVFAIAKGFSGNSIQSTELSVSARAFWQVIALPIRYGDRVTIRCEPSWWTIGKGQPGWLWVDANGYNVQADWVVLPIANVGSLIGRWEGTGTKSAIGCPRTFTAPSDGPLYLSVNDSDKREDNDGVIPVTVTVYHDSPIVSWLKAHISSQDTPSVSILDK